jgi:hypothetical protein
VDPGRSRGHTFIFPAFTLQPGADVRICTGCGQNGPGDLYWCKSGSAVWSNAGDTAYLYDSGDRLEDELIYSTKNLNGQELW